MSRKILIKRGLKQNLPVLDIGEWGFATDTNELFMGSASGNMQVANQDSVLDLIATLDEVKGQADTVEGTVTTEVTRLDGRVDEVEETITNEVTRIDSAVVAAQTKADAVEQAAAAAQAKADAVEIVATDAQAKAITLETAVGPVDQLQTQAKKIVEAINEQNSKVGNLLITVDANKPVQFTKKRPIVTFITDDGSIEDWNKLKPLSETYDIPMVAAIITSFTSGINSDYTKLRYLQDQLGWEIASHTVNHLDLGSLTESQLEHELKTSKETLTAQNLKVKNIVYPFGGSSSENRRIAKKYYRCGVAVSYPNGTNKGVIPSFDIKRVGIGSWFDPAVSGMPATNTLEYYKARVDQCFTENSWLVFMIHPGESSHDATQQSYLEQVIQYVQNKGIEVMTLDSAFDIFGNLWEAGDFMKEFNGDAISGLAVNKFGEESKAKPNFQIVSSSGITNSSGITSFTKNAVSLMSFGYSGTNGFPTTAGSLMTNYSQPDVEQSYQMWYDYFSEAMYRRRWRNSAWTSWEQLITKSYFDTNLFHKTAPMNSYSNTSLITDFPNNSITTCYVNSAASSGLPGIAGILTTYRIGENGVYRQEYRVYNTNQLWSRYTDPSTGSWTTWTRMTPSSGTTASRPASYPLGMPYFDTTLGKPIWRNAANSGWVDATGSAV